MNTNNESPAALLPDSAKARAYDKYMSELERLQAEQPRDSLSLQAGAVLLDHYAKEFASTAPVASESRGSVPEPINPHFWIDVIRTQAHVTDCREKQQALTNAANKLAQYIAAPTPPAVSSGEPTSGHWMMAFAEQYDRIGDADCMTDFNDLERRARELARSAAAKGEG